MFRSGVHKPTWTACAGRACPDGLAAPATAAISAAKIPQLARVILQCDSAAHAAVIVLRAKALEQRNGVRKRLHALNGTVRHVDSGLTGARDRFHVGAL